MLVRIYCNVMQCNVNNKFIERDAKAKVSNALECRLQY